MKTKLISLILVLAICITVGGVYAAWMYSETPMNAVHGHIGSFGLTSATVNIAKGTVTVNAEGAHLALDQGDGYVAVLGANGTIEVTFAASDTYMESNENPATVQMRYRMVSTNANPTAHLCSDGENTQPLFNKFVTDEYTNFTLTRDGETSNYKATIDATVLLNWMEVNEFVLNTYAKYETFSAGVGQFGNIGVEVSEIPAP